MALIGRRKGRWRPEGIQAARRRVRGCRAAPRPPYLWSSLGHIGRASLEVRLSSLLERVRQALAPDYAVERELAAGGMGVVFLGHDQRLDRPVAIKILQPGLATEAGALRFVREAQNLARVSHPNIVQVHDTGERQGIYFYVMEYLPGETLAERLHHGPLEPRAVTALGRALLGALGAAHAKQIVHRDIKPANVVLAGDRPVLIDFGIARAARDPTLTEDGQIVGTRAYMPWEQRAGLASAATDLYSMAALLYEACCGRRWDATRVPEQADWSGIPRRLRPALKRGLAVDPGRRWPNAGAFGASLPALIGPRRDGLALVVAATLLLLMVSRREPAPLPVRSDFAILPFVGESGKPEPGHQLASYLGNRLEWYPAWSLVPVPASMAWWDSTPVAKRIESSASAPRARLYVHGEVLNPPAGGLLRLTLRDSAARLVQVIDVPGAASDPLAWASAGADSVVSRTFPLALDDYRAVTRRSSGNVPAVNEWLQGQVEFRRDRWMSAETHYQRALELDTGFAQAAWDLALVLRWRRDSSAAVVLGRLWERSRDDLPAMQRLLTEALLEPDLERRFGLFAEAVHRFPRRAEAWLLYGNELFSRGPLGGIPLDSGVAAFTRTTRLEPYTTALEHTVLGYIRTGQQRLARSALDELLSAPAPGDPEAGLRRQLLRFAYDERFVQWRGRLGEVWLGWRPDSALLDGIRLYARMGNFFDIPNAQLALGRTLVESGRDAAAPVSGQQAQGLALLLLGRPSEALTKLDSAAALLRTREADLQLTQWPLLLSVLGLGEASPSRVEAARIRLAALADGPDAARAAWSLAIDARRRGDATGFARWADRLAADTAHDSTARPLSQLLGALAAADARRFDSAIALGTPLLRYNVRGLGGDPFARAVLHLELGAWLEREGDAGGAERAWLWTDAWDVEGWPDGEAQAGEVDAAVGAVARLRRGGLALKRGQKEQGCRLVTRVQELWSRADRTLPERGRADSLARVCS